VVGSKEGRQAWRARRAQGVVAPVARGDLMPARRAAGEQGPDWWSQPLHSAPFYLFK
jgi:hypothetical protein